MDILKYHSDDLEEIVELFFETVHEINRKDYTEVQLDAWAPQSERETLLKSWEKSLHEHISYVAKRGSLLVGFADITLEGYVDRIYVHKDFQGQGIAKELLEKLEGEAYELGLYNLSTDASITAVPFFKKQGYIIATEKTVLRNGIALRNFTMEKEL